MLHQCFNRCDFTCLTAGKKPGKESLSWSAAWRRGGKGNQRASEEMTSRWTASHSLPFCCWDFKKKTICTVIRIIWNLLKWVSCFVVLLQQGILFPDGNASEEAVRRGAAIVLLRKFNPYISDTVTSPWKHFLGDGRACSAPSCRVVLWPLPLASSELSYLKGPLFAVHHSFLLLSTPMATVHTKMPHIFHLGTSISSFTPNSII